MAVAGGAAEHLPLRSGCADLVTVAQGFHWFDPAPALHELARVLRPDGTLVLVWNERDLSIPWCAALDDVMRRAGDPPHQPTDQMRPTFDGDAHFSPFTQWRGPYEVTMTPQQVVDMVASRSYVRVLPEAARQAVLAEARAVVAPLGPSVVLPYVTSAYCARALAQACACPKEDPWSG
jgi:SAM-dependent methyltransferase